MYIGPDAIMPVASAVAAVAGLAVMFWHRTTGAVRGAFHFVMRQGQRLLGRS